MKRFIFICAALALFAGYPAVLKTQAVAQSGAPGAAAAADPQRAMLTTYCTTCHSSTAKMGGLALDVLNLDSVPKDAVIWEKAVRKLRGRLMPPPGAKQPEQKDIDSFVGFLETRLDSNTTGPKAGHVPIQRLSRTEYIAAVKALIGVDVKSKDILPLDAQIGGFDNIAAGLSASPSFVEQYVEAARVLAKQAVGDPSLDSVKYLRNANSGGEATPLGLRDGALRIKHNFPADGEYRINVLFPDGTLGLYLGSLENETTMVMMVDGKILFKKPIGGMEDLTLNNRKAGDGRAQITERFRKVPFQIQAGVREVIVGFIDRSRFESTSYVGGGGFGGGGLPTFDAIEINGPYKATGVSTLSHNLIYVCDPKKAGEAPCAKQIAENLAKRAFRRPVTDADVSRLMPFYEAGRMEGSFDQGVERLVAAVLVSPEFLYRSIRGPEGTAGTKPDAEVALTDYELATRLSFFIWNTGPDDELFKLASSKELSKPAVLDAQVKRMLADPRASSLVSSFAMKWLGLNDLDAVKVDTQINAGFNDQLKKDLATETETFVRSVLLEDRPIIELLTSNQTYLNDRVARQYGISGVVGSQFRWVTLTDRNRFGLLGKGAVLIKTSYPDRTSPVLRGKWVLENILGTPPTPPPPNVDTNLTQIPSETPKTVRARLEAHRDKASCKQCHGVIDPLGLALENFDAVGQFRTMDRQAGNTPLDVSTVLPSGVAINGPVELRDQLTAIPAKFAQTFTEKLMMYSVNRELEYFDMPQVRAVVRNAAKQNYTLSSIVLGIVHSDAFRKQGAVAAPKPATAKVAENK
jgi:mono/diheme cytochrome c family protein